MKVAVGVIGSALAASACCIGPVAFPLIGAGALGASAVKLEPFRPGFIGFTVLLVGVAFYGAYRPTVSGRCEQATCTPQATRVARILAWIAAVIAAMLIASPYYIGWFM